MNKEQVVRFLNKIFSRKLKKNINSGILVTVGYLLSPLSWWNDAFLNIPISYFIASLLSIFNREMFTACFVLTYMGTNVLGLILMHVGVDSALHENVRLDRKVLIKYLVISVVYTLIIAYLVIIGLIKPIQEIL